MNFTPSPSPPTPISRSLTACLTILQNLRFDIDLDVEAVVDNFAEDSYDANFVDNLNLDGADLIDVDFGEVLHVFSRSNLPEGHDEDFSFPAFSNGLDFDDEDAFGGIDLLSGIDEDEDEDCLARDYQADAARDNSPDPTLGSAVLAPQSPPAVGLLACPSVAPSNVAIGSQQESAVITSTVTTINKSSELRQAIERGPGGPVKMSYSEIVLAMSDAHFFTGSQDFYPDEEPGDDGLCPFKPCTFILPCVVPDQNQYSSLTETQLRSLVPRFASCSKGAPPSGKKIKLAKHVHQHAKEEEAKRWRVALHAAGTTVVGSCPILGSVCKIKEGRSCHSLDEVSRHLFRHMESMTYERKETDLIYCQWPSCR